MFQRLFWDTAAGLDPQAVDRQARSFAAEPALPGGLRGLFVAAGLDRIEESLITMRMEYANFDDYSRPLLGGQGPVAQLRRGACGRPAGADRDGGAGGLLRGHARWTACDVGDRLGGARDRAMTAIDRARRRS